MDATNDCMCLENENAKYFRVIQNVMDAENFEFAEQWMIRT